MNPFRFAVAASLLLAGVSAWAQSPPSFLWWDGFEACPVPVQFLPDRDIDDFGDDAWPFNGCGLPPGSDYADVVGGDCDDEDPSINPAAPEACNGIDDNCNGVVDDNVPDVGASCTTAFPGVCSAGTLQCGGAAGLQCIADTLPGSQEEICNGIDDDCNDVVDDNVPDVGTSCATGFPGACSAGTLQCGGAAGLQCVADTLPGSQDEVCDGIDNDCDGTVDEGC